MKKIIIYKKKFSESAADVILQQLGGNKFKVMTGAKNISKGTNSNGDEYLSIQLPRANKSIKFVKITLTKRDTYDMEFGKISGNKYIIVDLKKDIYSENLQEIFSMVTGLNTHL